MTTSEVMDAARVPEPCPYCRMKTEDFKRHKKECRKAKKAKKKGLAEFPTPKYSRIIKFKSHKTYRGKSLPVVVDSTLHDLLVLWIQRMHVQEAPDTRVFEGIRWEHLLTMLKRIVGSKILAAAKQDGPIGSKAMRQYASTAILKKSPKPQEAMRRIGGSEAMAKRHYQDQREHAFQKLEEKRMLLASSSSSGSSSEDSTSSEEEDSDPADGSPCSDSGDSDSQDKKRPKGKLLPGMKAGKSSKSRRKSSSSSSSSDGRSKSSNIVGYSDSESSASSEDAQDPERAKGKRKKTSKRARYATSGSESETITRPPPVVESAPPPTPLPDASQPTVTTPEEAEVPDVSREALAGTTTPDASPDASE